MNDPQTIRLRADDIGQLLDALDVELAAAHVATPDADRDALAADVACGRRAARYASTHADASELDLARAYLRDALARYAGRSSLAG